MTHHGCNLTDGYILSEHWAPERARPCSVSLCVSMSSHLRKRSKYCTQEVHSTALDIWMTHLQRFTGSHELPPAQQCVFVAQTVVSGRKSLGELKTPPAITSDGSPLDRQGKPLLRLHSIDITWGGQMSPCQGHTDATCQGHGP